MLSGEVMVYSQHFFSQEVFTDLRNKRDSEVMGVKVIKAAIPSAVKLSIVLFRVY